MNKHLQSYLRRTVLCCSVIPLLTTALWGGDITGRVVDKETGTFLPGATVNLSGTARTAVTDREGRFRFSGVDAGGVTLNAEYLSYPNQSVVVEVPVEGAASIDIAMAMDTVVLTRFVVEGMREGRSKALQQKKTMTNIADIVSADSVGNLPDRNVADAVSRMPGVSVLVDAGEGRYVSIRGTDPNLNAVTLNGATMATPGVDGRSGRSMPLDLVSSSQISQIEVIKTLTPDMDATGIGGAINIRTASAFDRNSNYLNGSVSGGESSSANEKLYEADVSFGSRFGRNKAFGLTVSGNYSFRPVQNEWLWGEWAVVNFSGTLTDVPSRLRFTQENIERTRMGFNANLEYRPSEDRQFYFRTIVNKSDEEVIGQEQLNDSRGGPSLITPTTVQWSQARTDRRVISKPREQILTNFSLGGKLRFGVVTLMPEITYSLANEKLPRELTSAQFLGNATSAAPLIFDFSKFAYGMTVANTTWTDPAQFPFQRIIIDASDVKESAWTPRMDAEFDLSKMRIGADTVFLKLGAKYSMRERYVHDTSERYRGNITLATTGAAIPGRTVFGQYNTGLQIDYAKMRQYMFSNLDNLTYDAIGSSSNSVEDSYDLEENIGAAYAMATAKYGKLTILGGVRWESTEGTIRGYEFRTKGGIVEGIFPNDGSINYDNILPNLQLRYEANKSLILRAAISTSIGRPKFEDTAPKAQLNWADAPGGNPAFPFLGDVNEGNPDLKPFEALNFDVGLEYFLPSGGMISIAGFHKEVENPIYRKRENLTNVIYKNLGFEFLAATTLKNAEKGSITGMEIGVQWPLDFLTGPFSGLGIDANYTIIESKVTVFERPGETLTFFEQPDSLANFALYYQRGRIQARVAWNYQSSSLKELGSSVRLDAYRSDRYSVDAQVGFKLNQHFTIFVNGQNLTDQTQEQYSGAPNRMREIRDFGYNIRAGVTFNF